MSAATRSTASICMDGVTCMYVFQVITVDAWPSCSLTIFMSIPAFRARVAHAWRRSWSLILSRPCRSTLRPNTRENRLGVVRATIGEAEDQILPCVARPHDEPLLCHSGFQRRSHDKVTVSSPTHSRLSSSHMISPTT